MQSASQLQQEISSNKFYPPQVDPASSLFRSALITRYLGKTACTRKAIIIEAQAGQGKSTLAAQFLHHFNLRFAWYQIGPEDTDPALLLSALLDNLQQKLPGFKSPQLALIMRQGEIGPLDVTRCANILLTDLDRHLAGDFYIVFDDLHLGEQAPLLNNLLSHIIDTSPPHLHFVLISRKALALTARTLRYGTDVCMLQNQDLSLSLQEVEMLFSRVLKQQISRRDAELIRQQTSGWIMGILLAALGDKRQRKSAKFNTGNRLPADLSSDQILSYFRHEILDHVPEDLHTILMRLSLLSEIPIDLAATITGQRDAGAILTDLMLDNFFLYPLDEQQTVFRLHHLFQEFLQERAKKFLSRDEIKAIYSTAAAYYLDKGALEQALLCYRKEENFQVMEDILRREGLNMMAKNRVITLLTLLKSIPEDKLLNYAWLTLFTGYLYSDFHPQKTEPLLESARNRFIITGDETGELLALSHLIYFHFVVSGLYHTGALLLPRIEELFTRNREDLPLHAQIVIARNLGAGYCFFISRMKQARAYATMARDLATGNDIRNGIASTRFTCGYIESLIGNYKSCLQEIETSYALLHDPLVGMSNKLTLRILHLNFLSKRGDFINLYHQQQLLRNSIDNHVVEQTVAAPYLYIWECAGLVEAGEYDKAEQVLQMGGRISATAETPHMRSQLLQWYGYIQALQGKEEAAEKAVTEAAELRQVAGGPFYDTFCTIIHGATLARIGHHDEALKLLTTALHKAEGLPSDYMAAAARLHRAWVYRQQDCKKAMLDDLQAGLNLLKKNSYTYFWSWEPGFMEQLLSEAFRAGILPEFSDGLARKQLGIFFDKKGSAYPLLDITILGPFALQIAGKTILTAEKLTPAQRSLMALLLACKDQKISQERIQLTLWPDSSPDKARAKLDMLLMRLRKVLGQALPCPVSQYLSMQKGFLCLDNCRIDGVEFDKLATKGLNHARAEQFWQAGNAFYRALRLWDNGTATGSDLFIGETSDFYDQLLRLLAKIGHTYGIILAESDCAEEAIDVATKILQINRMDDQLITLLYGLYIRCGKMLKAKETLLQYRQSLRDLEYSQDEIDDLLFKVAASTS